MGEVGRQAAKAAGAAEKATESRGFVLAARVGFVAAGLLHVMIGVIALRIASGGSGTADQSGAIQELATTPGGGVLLWICFLGCVALALFLLAQALVGAGRRRGREQTKARLKAAGQAVVYGAIGAAFGVFALGGSSSSSRSTQSLTATLMANPAGTVLLTGIGLGLIVAAGYYVYSGATRRFRKNLRTLPPGPAGTAVTVVGSVGYIAKGIALGVLGVVVTMAAAQHDPQRSTGLDGALKALQQQPYGAWLLGAVAMGLIGYGLYLVVRARYQRM